MNNIEWKNTTIQHGYESYQTNIYWRVEIWKSNKHDCWKWSIYGDNLGPKNCINLETMDLELAKEKAIEITKERLQLLVDMFQQHIDRLND